MSGNNFELDFFTKLKELVYKIFFYPAKKRYKKLYPDVKIIFPVSIDNNCSIGKNTVIHKNVRLSNSTLGDYSYTHSSLLNSDVGKFCSIAPNCIFGLAKHPTEKIVSTYPAFYSKNNRGCLCSFSHADLFDEQPGKTIIGNDVWVGSNCIIMAGVIIGNGAIIGAGSVVTKDVEDYAIVGGVPAKLIRYRFEKDQINFLNQFKWWDRDIGWIENNCSLFLDIEKFCNFAK
jgi:acetyltransferase-like isoleucine patch superfamily enzyme